MGVQLGVFQSVDQGGQTVALGVQIWCIDLVYVAREDDLAVFSGKGNTGFDLMGREVLCFVDNEENIGMASSAYVGQRCDLKLFKVYHSADALVFLVRFVVL